MINIKNVAVLGTGVMGSQIAAHCANAGLNVMAFDMSQEISESGISKASKIKPNAFYDKKSTNNITCFNYDEHVEKIIECDWIIEVIAERLDWKKDLYKKITPFIEGKIITSNTSGISLSELTDDLSDDIKKNFFINKFFYIRPSLHTNLFEHFSTRANNNLFL